MWDQRFGMFCDLAWRFVFFLIIVCIQSVAQYHLRLRGIIVLFSTSCLTYVKACGSAGSSFWCCQLILLLQTVVLWDHYSVGSYQLLNFREN